MSASLAGVSCAPMLFLLTDKMHSGCSTDATGLEYKYVVRNTDGGIAAWKPGGNFCLQLASHLQQRQELLERIQVHDAWDGLSRINVTWGTLHPVSTAPLGAVRF